MKISKTAKGTPLITLKSM